MNRRHFLKRAAAVVIGSVAVPTAIKALPFKPNLAQGRIFTKHKMLDGRVFYTWTQVKGLYNFKDPPEDFLNEVSKRPKHEIGELAFTGDGRTYRYMKNCTTDQLIRRYYGYYTTCPKCERVDLHDYTRCTG